MRNIYKFLLFILLNTIVIIANAQGTCATAITLTPGTQQCGTNSYVGSFPDDNSAPNNPCDNYYNDGEYWFKYVGTGKPLKLTVSGLSDTYSGIYVLSACPASSPTCLASHSNSSSTANYSVTTPVLTTGVTYYIVIANWSSPYSTNFCLDAVEIPTYNMTNGGNISSCAGIFMDPEGTANYADHNGTWTMTFCSNNGQALQFNFTQFETKETNDNLTIYDGPNTSSPSLGTYSTTNSPGTITSSGTCLTFAWTTDNNQAGTPGWTANFSCVPLPPANNECSNATELTINSPTSCNIVTHGTTQSATASSQTISPCYGTADDDVWYTFIASSTTLDLSLLNITGSSTDMYFAVYSGNNCSSLTNILCSDPNSARLTGLTIGSRYYVRVYTYSSGYYANFDICLSVPPPPPANDECSDAIHLSVNPDQNCGTVVHGSVSDATASSQTNPCYGTADDDIWYSFVATSNRHDISLLNITGSTTDMYIAVYGGSCGSLTNILCSDTESAVIDGLTPGMTYYVRIYTYTSTSGQTSSFDICVGTPPPPDPGDLCSMSLPFCSDSTYNFPAGVNSGTGQTGPDYCCLYSTPNPVWYFLRVEQPGDIELDIHSDPQKDLDFICWGPFTDIDDPCMYPTTYLTNSGGCSSHHAPGPGGGYPSGNTVDCSYDASYQEWCYIPNAQVGEFYILLITNYSNQPTNIIFEQISGSGATDCNVVTCNMSSITATPTACNPSTNFYSLSGTITFTDPPTSGQLIVTDNSGATQTFNPPFISPINYTINNINSDGVTHTVTAQFTSSPACTNYIVYNAPPACNMCTPNSGPDMTVCGMTTNLEAVINPDNASYHWSPTAGISFADVNSPTTSITATAPGVYTLTWNVTSTYGVTCTDQVTITFDNPTVTATASPTSICNGQTSVLTASGANTYSWSGGLGTGASKTVTPSATTTYTVTGTSTAGCTGTATVSVTVNPLPTVTASASPSAICNGASSVLTASGANTYSWSGGLGSGASKTVTPSTTTTYTVTGTSTAGCTGTATVSVTVNPLPTVTATASPTSICNGQTSV
ncbi:MAG: hypothetical protein QMD02_05385, partial [Bacteroidales bacterium]|nr:hypothetical protein [Bacteroidales bacterium]